MYLVLEEHLHMEVQNTIDYVTIATLGDAIDFGDLTAEEDLVQDACNSTLSSSTRGLIAGGATEIMIDYITIASTGNALDFGDLSLSRNPRGVSNCIRGVFGSGNAASPVGQNNVIDYVTIATLRKCKRFW